MHCTQTRNPFHAARRTLFSLTLALGLGGAGAAHAANWTNCGSEGGNCSIPTGARAVIRYGSASNGFFYSGASGLTSVPCTNFSGDPAWGQGKSCAYSTDLSLLNAGTYYTVANEGQTFNVGATPVWVRYGAGGRWYETVQSGPVTCSNAFFNFDPNENSTKVCQVGDAVNMATTTWTDCAAEDSTCALGSSGEIHGVLLRYGLNGNWTYRITDVDNIACRNDRFNKDPSYDQKKLCQYAPLRRQALTFGKWELKVACNGCYNSQYTVQWGTERSSEQMQSQEWSTTVTTSLEEGFEIDGVSAKISYSVAQGYARSSSFTTSLSRTYGQSMSVTCGTGTGQENIRLYQFRTSTTAECLLAGTCSGETFTTETFCAVNPPANYQGPQCLLSQCNTSVNAFCTTCR
ncbi:hypothetical protein P2318_15945 [Myxococcaceae bacterium GXIMD 01537]